METRTITFDPGPHTYVDEYKVQYTSVTQLIQKVEPEYDDEFWSMYRAVDQMGTYKPRPLLEDRLIEVNFMGSRIPMTLDALYSGIIPLPKSPRVIKAEWEKIKDDSCEWGSAKHEYLEDCINRFSSTGGVAIHNIQSSTSQQGYLFKVTNLKELENSPLKFTYPVVYEKIAQMINNGWIAYAEKRVYNAYYRVAGTIDLFFVRGKEFFILDWKTNKDPLKFEAGYFKKEWNSERTKKIKTNKWIPTTDRLLYPVLALPHCKGSVYTLQLSMYAFLCEQWDFEYKGCVLCHIRPYIDSNDEVVLLEDGTRKEHEPEFFKIEYRKAEVNRLLDWNIGNLDKGISN